MVAAKIGNVPLKEEVAKQFQKGKVIRMHNS
jgi:hypothetical protein